MYTSAGVVIIAGILDSRVKVYHDTTYAFSVSLLSKVFHQGKAISVEITRLKTWFANMSAFPRNTRRIKVLKIVKSAIELWDNKRLVNQ